MRTGSHVLGVILGSVAAAALAGVVYLARERLGAAGFGMAALRTIAFGALLLVLFNPGSARRVAGGPATVLLDASLSLDAAGGRWPAALDTARALAGDGGAILRFGARVAPYDSSLPTEGSTRLAEALRVSAGLSRGGGPVIVVSDGEVEDGGTVPPSLLAGAGMVLLPRDTVPAAALLDVVVWDRVLRDDTLAATLVVGTWGSLDTANALVEILLGERRILTRSISLPPSPGTARRSLAVAPGSIPLGTHVLDFRLTVPGDAEPRDNLRRRVVTVTAQPAIVVVVDPADIEGRFLLSELSQIAGTGVRGYARVQAGQWVDMLTQGLVDEGVVLAARRNAALVILRGPGSQNAETSTPVWHWPAGSDPTAEFFDGDWYPAGDLPPSPLAGRLAAVEWDSLPPLTGIVPVIPTGVEWTGLTGRLARRGAERALLVGRDSSRRRRLTTAGAGMWRWVLRGGAAREAYRALVAAGTDWLLGTDGISRAVPIVANSAVARGLPVTFRWTGPSPPDSLALMITGPDSTRHLTVSFDAAGLAPVSLEPGVYTWSFPEVRAAQGIAVVEEFSDEFHPRTVTLVAGEAASSFALVVRRARENWWLFLVAALALLGEWGWRQRRGLP
jgi:hypothetical protein